LPHTADILLRAEGDGASELLAAAADGLCALVVERPPGASSPEHRFSLDASDLRSLVIAALNELLLLTSDGLVTGCCSATVSRTGGGYAAEVRCHVEPYRREIHGDRREIKAATYHDVGDLSGASPSSWRMDILIDL